MLRERLQTALAGLWLLDGLLQLQPYMFTENFAHQTLSAAADGNPAWVAHAVTWSTGLVAGHPVVADTCFALVQIALGLGIAHPRTRRAALGASVVWAGGVWLFGEGLGALLSGQANPLTGAPGAAALYGLAAILLWPGTAPGSAPSGEFPAAGLLRARHARMVWSTLWLGLAALTLLPANRAPGAFVAAMTGGMMTVGEPQWYTALQDHPAHLTLGHDLAVALVLAALLALVAAAPWAPDLRIARAGVALAMIVALAYWVCGEAFGMPFTGMATDPNSGPLLALLAPAYLPASPELATAPATAAAARPEGATA
ncbi:hypothetical protein KDL01_06830 [Actinospica durhamensis]|uniref:Uncharacterized protein n=1 Tax=Actinospica durhamensis TaxID=1508375 RepID=A0A941ESD2_9ACTN|nr:hypothetical protein [Actinospica durhamensis]MBR7832969.1 hypothetical protein [Actinospica durhamensis]